MLYIGQTLIEKGVDRLYSLKLSHENNQDEFYRPGFGFADDFIINERNNVWYQPSPEESDRIVYFDELWDVNFLRKIDRI